jgi:L-ascorbate metabolism protein UlaG (beta-lactamase superfamily)
MEHLQKNFPFNLLGNSRKRSMWIALALILVATFVCGAVLGCCTFSVSGYKGPPSDHFDGKRFYNQGNSTEQGFFTFLKWITMRDAPEWHKVPAVINHMKLPQRVAQGDLQITFINHSTFLIQMNGINILTDPLWSDRTSPVSFSGPQRVQQPGVLLADLPPIDAVVLSHNHYDHLDLPTLKKITARDKPRMFVGLGNRILLNKAGINNVREMDWWEQETLSDTVAISFVPARHFSNRGMCDHNKSLWGGFVFESASGAVYFAGDTGFGLHFEQIANRFKHLRLALLPIGAFQPEWFMAPHHMSPPDALKAHFILRAQTSVAMHYGTFRLGDDRQNEPVDTLRSEIAATDMHGTQFWIMEFGESKTVPPF